MKNQYEEVLFLLFFHFLSLILIIFVL